MNTCLHCQREYSPHKSSQKYCSSKCTNRANVKRYRQKNTQRRYVDGVHYKSIPIMEMTIQEYCDFRHPKPKHLIMKDSRYYAHSWNPGLSELSCEECGYDKHVEIAHIIPVSTFSVDTKLKTVHDRSNLKVLCPNCHWEFDNLPK
jgi:5-methylcytosine-specific restriction endonuclease McrA